MSFLNTSRDDNNNNKAQPFRGPEEQSRRYACDRCRGQKLRCERRASGGTNTTCKRCAKARAQCITSPSVRMGRPRRHTSPSTANLPPFTGLDFDISPSTDSTNHGLPVNYDTQSMGVPSNMAAPPSDHGQGHDPDGESEIQAGDDAFQFSFDSKHMLVDGLEFHNYQDFYGKAEASQAFSATDLREECLQKLSDLTSNLFKQLSRVSSGKLSDPSVLSSTSSSSSPTKPSERGFSPTASPGSRYPIGDMLDGSQKFLEVLKYFVHSPPPSTRSSLLSYASPSSFSDYEGEVLSPNHRRPSSKSTAAPTSTSLSHIYTPSFSPFNDFNTPAHITPISTGLLRPDFPTILATLSCYVVLVRIYRTVFTHIYMSLLAGSSMVAESPPILPGLQLDGFQLEQHRNLQVAVLLQVSMDMMDQIEMATKSLAALQGIGQEDLASVPLTEMLTRLEADEVMDGDKGVAASLKTVMQNLRVFLTGEMSA